MFKNKLVKIMMIILGALTIIGVLTYFLINHFTSSSPVAGEPTIDEVIALSVDTEEITTNLQSNDYIRVQFRIQVSSKDAKSELEKRDFQVENLIIRELSGARATDLSGAEGIEVLEDRIKQQLNEILQTGAVVQIYTTRLLIQ